MRMPILSFSSFFFAFEPSTSFYSRYLHWSTTTIMMLYKHQTKMFPKSSRLLTHFFSLLRKATGITLKLEPGPVPTKPTRPPLFLLGSSVTSVSELAWPLPFCFSSQTFYFSDPLSPDSPRAQRGLWTLKLEGHHQRSLFLVSPKHRPFFPPPFIARPPTLIPQYTHKTERCQSLNLSPKWSIYLTSTLHSSIRRFQAWSLKPYPSQQPASPSPSSSIAD